MSVRPLEYPSHLSEREESARFYTRKLCGTKFWLHSNTIQSPRVYEAARKVFCGPLSRGMDVNRLVITMGCSLRTPTGR